MVGQVGPDIDLCIQRVTSDWDETVIYSTAPTQDTTCISTETINEEAGLYYWPGLADLVQSWIDVENFGLGIVLTGPAVVGTKPFYSNEGGIYKPELTVRYSLSP